MIAGRGTSSAHRECMEGAPLGVTDILDIPQSACVLSGASRIVELGLSLKLRRRRRRRQRRRQRRRRRRRSDRSQRPPSRSVLCLADPAGPADPGWPADPPPTADARDDHGGRHCLTVGPPRGTTADSGLERGVERRGWEAGLSQRSAWRPQRGQSVTAWRQDTRADNGTDYALTPNAIPHTYRLVNIAIDSVDVTGVLMIQWVLLNADIVTVDNDSPITSCYRLSVCRFVRRLHSVFFSRVGNNTVRWECELEGVSMNSVMEVAIALIFITPTSAMSDIV